jgi:flagellar basal body P-ring formation protein FlgA
MIRFSARPATLPETLAAFCIALLFFCGGTAIAQAQAVQLVARVIIYPGEIIGPDRLIERSVTGNILAREIIATTAEQVIGKVAKRTIVPGQTIALSALRDPDLIRAGKKVTLTFLSGQIQISCEGVAMQSGAIGDLISVQNSDSSVVVRGRVQPDGQVRVGE